MYLNIISEYSSMFHNLFSSINIDIYDEDYDIDDQQYIYVLKKIIELASHISNELNEELYACDTFTDKMNVIDKYYGISFISKDIIIFILNSDLYIKKLFESDVDFTLSVKDNVLYINDIETDIDTSKLMKQTLLGLQKNTISFAECKQNPNRTNRQIIKQITTLFEEEFENTLLTILTKHFNYFVLLE